MARELPEIAFESPWRLAFRADRRTLARLIPPHTIGTYLLLRGGSPIYIGRSDCCLRSRLVSHERLGSAEHVVWEIYTSAMAAFYSEAAWFHRLVTSKYCLNQIHPAAPLGGAATCPLCEPGAAEALEHALRRRRVELGGAGGGSRGATHGVGEADREGGSPQTIKEE
jgi:hypothetical protein